MFWQVEEDCEGAPWFYLHPHVLSMPNQYSPLFIWHQCQGLKEPLEKLMRRHMMGFFVFFSHNQLLSEFLLPCQYPVEVGDDWPETILRRSWGEGEEKNEEELQVSKVSAFSSLLSPSFTTSTFSLAVSLFSSSLWFPLHFVVAFFTNSLLPSEVVRLCKTPDLTKQLLSWASKSWWW